ncbi:hypothetical protein M422DRAFT_241339 [Sphaerobolus stellatus SS14]|nr:hypothetical protein M422DRAFT_241339 [Sphaerobolus stellatus SS14]
MDWAILSSHRQVDLWYIMIPAVFLQVFRIPTFLMYGYYTVQYYAMHTTNGIDPHC